MNLILILISVRLNLKQGARSNISSVVQVLSSYDDARVSRRCVDSTKLTLFRLPLARCMSSCCLLSLLCRAQDAREYLYSWYELIFSLGFFCAFIDVSFVEFMTSIRVLTVDRLA